MQIYTPGLYLHRDVYCAYERGFNRSNNSLSHYLLFVHKSVHIILNQLDILDADLFEFDILAFTETWTKLNTSIQSDDLVFQSFHKPERKD